MDRLRAAADCVGSWCERNGVDAADALRITLVVEELFTNIVQHGYRGSGNGTVRLALALDGHAVLLVCEDDAPAFDPRPTLMRVPGGPDEPVETRSVGGLGHLLVGRLAEVVGYARVNGANRLSLRFRRGPARP